MANSVRPAFGPWLHGHRYSTPGAGGVQQRIRNVPLGPSAFGRHAVRVGDGRARSQVRTTAERAGSAFRLMGLAAVTLLALPLLVPFMLLRGAMRPLAKALRPDDGACLPKALTHLQTPRKDGVTADNAAMNALYEYAASIGSPLAKHQIAELVAVGEHVAFALGALADSKEDRAKPRDGENEIPSDGYTVRALSWYMMALAAQQDGARPTPDGAGQRAVRSDLLTNGSIVIKDPGKHIFTFLRRAPLMGPRPSTHYRERSAAEKNIEFAFVRTDVPEQWGCEDFHNRFPGQRGAILFDSLKPGTAAGDHELFVKFERAGVPRLLLPGDGTPGQKAAYFVAALDRNLAHATAFTETRFEWNAPGGNRRYEHVEKGALRKDIYRPFEDLVDYAIRAGLIAQDRDAVLRGVRKFGLPFVKEALNRMQRIANGQLLGLATMPGSNALGDGVPGAADADTAIADSRAKRRARKADFLAAARHVQNETGALLTEIAALRTTDRSGIEARGDEVHLVFPGSRIETPGNPVPDGADFLASTDGGDSGK